MCAAGSIASADDGIFAAAPAAKSFIDFDGRGFLLNGKRTFLASGSLHYSRVPQALWHDRLLRIKRAGFNTIQTYAFWNFHEPKEGKWDFTGDHDFNAFLKQVKDLGMYAVVRPGPYVCAEWDSGGYPVWLRFKKGVRVREDNPQFEAAVDAWYDKILPIIAANQIHRGGAVIMVQLENEHPQGWGKEMPNGYFKHLRDKALAAGIEVPYFFSGLHHGSDPAGDTPWNSAGRSNPWYTTEFWPGWYDLYGPLDPGRLRSFDRGVWKILAYGGNGYNFYMLHGGTDFDTWNDDEVASSYDYGSAVGQAGDLRPIYYRFKIASLFARSFPDILEDSENATQEYKSFAGKSGLRVTARKGAMGTIVFLDNNSDKWVTWRGSSLYPGEIMPQLVDYKLLPNLTLERENAHILGMTRQGKLTTLVIYGYTGFGNPYGAPAESPELKFAVPADGVQQLIGKDAFHEEPGHLVLTPSYATKPVNEYMFAVGDEKIRVLAVSSTMADHVWFVEEGGSTYIIGGPQYVGDVAVKDGKLHLTAEQYVSDELKPSGTFVYGPDETSQQLDPALSVLNAASPMPEAPTLAPWQMRTGSAEAQKVLVNDATGSWKDGLAPMGADGDTSAYAWYRAPLTIDKAGTYTLRFADAGDWVSVFVNGEHAGAGKVRQRFDHPAPRSMSVTLQAGENTIAVLTAHYGRNKLFNHLGPIDVIDAKGIAGPVTLSRTAGGDVEVTRWRWKAVSKEDADKENDPTRLDPSSDGWQNAKIGQDVFNKHPGFAWYRATLENVKGAQHLLHFDGVDDNATVWLNGKKLVSHKGWNEPFDVSLDSAWRDSSTNELAVLVENVDNSGGITGSVTLHPATPGDDAAVSGWKMRGGIGDPMGKDADWTPYDTTAKAGEPRFYRTTFNAAPPADAGMHPIVRISLQGLSRGFVWLNGHNLGRYPERVPMKDIYLPECWLQGGSNTLVIFDEEGKSPKQAKLVTESAASRLVTQHTTVPATPNSPPPKAGQGV